MFHARFSVQCEGRIRWTLILLLFKLESGKVGVY